MCRGEINCGLIGGKSLKKAKKVDLKIKVTELQCLWGHYCS